MYAGLCIPNTLHKKPCRIGSGLCGTSENSLMTKFAEFRLSVVGWVVSSLIRVSIGTAHGPAHANGLGFFVGKGEMFQVLALPYVLLPTPVEDPYGAQSVLNILDLQSGAIYACLHPHQRYNVLPLFFGYVHASTPLHQFPNHLRRHRRNAGSCGPAVAGRGQPN